MRKIVLATLASLGALGAATATAESFPDRARVLSSHPVIEQLPVDREECWNDRVRGYEDRRVTRSDTGAAIGPGTVLGAIVGGVAGHQVGRGRGNDVATAAGALVGGLVGNQIDRQNSGPPGDVTEVERVPVEHDVRRCRTVHEVREATVGYDVRYEYRGREFRTRLPQDPGRSLPVNVEVRPVETAYRVPPPPPPPRPHPPVYSR
ncbi:MAG TPA: glycine zipper 2TM domain-containing protein [Usitatibacter sp.]|nr:glycine zipper 2TM domain-containing protein [Usitatibacter sp.]